MEVAKVFFQRQWSRGFPWLDWRPVGAQIGGERVHGKARASPRRRDTVGSTEYLEGRMTSPVCW